MTYEQYTHLIETSPRITLSGFRTGRGSLEKETWKQIDEISDKMLKKAYPLFCLCCRRLQSMPPIPRGELIWSVKFSIENREWLNSGTVCDIPLGVVMLAAISEGHQLRQCRGSHHGTTRGKGGR